VGPGTDVMEVEVDAVDQSEPDVEDLLPSGEAVAGGRTETMDLGTSRARKTPKGPSPYGEVWLEITYTPFEDEDEDNAMAYGDGSGITSTAATSTTTSGSSSSSSSSSSAAANSSMKSSWRALGEAKRDGEGEDDGEGVSSDLISRLTDKLTSRSRPTATSRDPIAEERRHRSQQNVPKYRAVTLHDAKGDGQDLVTSDGTSKHRTHGGDGVPPPPSDGSAERRLDLFRRTNNQDHITDNVQTTDGFLVDSTRASSWPTSSSTTTTSSTSASTTTTTSSFGTEDREARRDLARTERLDEEYYDGSGLGPSPRLDLEHLDLQLDLDDLENVASGTTTPAAFSELVRLSALDSMDIYDVKSAAEASSRAAVASSAAVSALAATRAQAARAAVRARAAGANLRRYV
jgi:hypothetical protein